MIVKECHKEVFTGLDNKQLQYAAIYGYEKEDLEYRHFVVVVQKSHRDMPKMITCLACCREHARDQYPGAVNVL